MPGSVFERVCMSHCNCRMAILSSDTYGFRLPVSFVSGARHRLEVRGTACRGRGRITVVAILSWATVTSKTPRIVAHPHGTVDTCSPGTKCRRTRANARNGLSGKAGTAEIHARPNAEYSQGEWQAGTRS